MLNSVRERLLPSVFMLKGYAKVEGDTPDPETNSQIAWKEAWHGSSSVVKVDTDPVSGQRIAYFLTNNHVVSNPKLKDSEEKVETMTHIVLPSGKERMVTSSYQDRASYFRDIAIVKVALEKDDENPVPVTIDVSPVSTGTTIVVAGFPGNQVELITSSGEIARPLPAKSFDGEKDAYRISMAKGFVANVRENPGDSGGAVTDTKGRVIGLAGHNDNGGNGTVLLPVMIPASEFFTIASHPEVFINAQSLFDTEGKKINDDDGIILPLTQRFSAVVEGISVSLRGLPDQSIREILEDPGMRAMFDELKKNVRSLEKKQELEDKFMAAFGRYKVSSLYELKELTESTTALKVTAVLRADP